MNKPILLYAQRIRFKRKQAGKNVEGDKFPYFLHFKYSFTILFFTGLLIFIGFEAKAIAIASSIKVMKSTSYLLYTKDEHINGTVLDSSTGQPLAGVTIKVQGYNIGTITDADGRFDLEVPDNTILEIRYLGYGTKIISVNDERSLKIYLTKGSSELNELVVVGYERKKKIDLTGAVSSINFESKEMQSRPLVNVSTALSGMAAGVAVNQASGNPQKDEATIHIRGVGTLNSGDEPLVIIDGQPGDMNQINPMDVASISILKDAASAAIYGSRAANGVILITTKLGKNTDGKFSFNYNGYVGTTAPTKIYNVISYVPDYMRLINRIQRNSGIREPFSQQRIDEWTEKSKTDPIKYPNTDWYSVIMKPNILMSHTISVSGGTNKINLYTSLGFQDNNGVVLKSGVTKWTFRNNIGVNITNWLTIGNQISAYLRKDPPGIAKSLFVRFPDPAVTPYAEGYYGIGMAGATDENRVSNLLYSVNSAQGETHRRHYTGKIYAIIKPIERLNIRGSYYLDKNDYDLWRSTNYPPLKNFQTDDIVSSGATYGSIIRRQFNKTNRRVIDIYANYKRSFDKHHIEFIAGFNQEKYDNVWFGATKSELISNMLNALDAASFNPQNTGTGTSYRNRSYFGRINYNFRHKYLFEANIRYDGSSRFSSENRWGSFPSFSAGWIISKEKFWKTLNKTITFLKLRASWGQLGNNGIGNYAWQNVYSASDYSFNGSRVQGIAPNQLVDENVTWETTDMTNFGLDLNLLKKFSVTFNYYNKFTHGILAQMPIPGVNGPLDPPYINAAEVRNKGFEADLKYYENFGRLFVKVGLLGSYNKNRLVKFKGPGNIENHGIGASSWVEGYPIGIFYVREVDHIIQDQNEIDKLKQEGYTWQGNEPGPGDFLFKDNDNDKNFETDQDEGDYVLKGYPIPVYNFGINLSLAFKGFDFYILGQGVARYTKMLSGYDVGSLEADIGAYGYPKRWIESWTPENHSTTIPKIYSNNGINSGDNDYFLDRADYFRIKTIQLGYTIPQNILSRFKIDKLRIYLNFENYFQFTNYIGMDPEANNYSTALNYTGGGGADTTPNSGNTYPLFKTASIGLNISF